MPGIHTIRSDRFQRLFRETIWVAIGWGAALLGSVAGVRILTEYLSPDAYGELALAMTLTTLAQQTLLGPLSNGAARFYGAARDRGEVRSYLGAVRGLAAKAALAMAVVMAAVLAVFFVLGRTQWFLLAAAAAVFALLAGCNSVLNGVQSAARQRPVVALHQGLSVWLRFAAAAGLMAAFGSGSTAAMCGYAAASCAVLASQYAFLAGMQENGSGKDGPSVRSWSDRIWEYSWPFAAWGIFAWAQQSSDRWALDLFGTKHEVGLYAALFQLGYSPILLASGVAMDFLAPILYGRAGDLADGRRRQAVHVLAGRLTASTLGLTALAFVVTLAFHRTVFRLFAASEYGTVSSLLPWVVLAGGIFAAGQTISLNLMSQMKTQSMIGVKITVAIAGAAGNAAGAYWAGVPGVIAAGVSTSILYLIWMTALLKRHSLANRPDGPPWD